MSNGYALLFPGQGAQTPGMLAGVAGGAAFKRRYEIVCDLAKADLAAALGRSEHHVLNANKCSSLLTVLASTEFLDTLRERVARPPGFLAGYSVGQWVALYAAGVVSFEGLAEIVAVRADLMDECMRAEPGAMCAVIGLPKQAVETVLADMRADGFRVFVANYNCLGQYSVSGARAAIAEAEQRLARLHPKKLTRLPVAGAWHCPLLDSAASAFQHYLQGCEFAALRTPVADNVSGGWLPDEPAQLRESLAKHVSHAVRWDDCIRTIISKGCLQFIEVGHGNMLTKFGFFIDRNARFTATHEFH